MSNDLLPNVSKKELILLRYYMCLTECFRYHGQQIENGNQNGKKVRHLFII